MYLKKFKICLFIVLMLLTTCLTFAACATPQTAETQKTEPEETKSTAVPTEEPTPEALPEIGELEAAWDGTAGIVLTWTPFDCDYDCTLERKDSEAGEYVSVSDVDSTAGTFTDNEPGEEGMSPIYRLSVRDGEREAYSGEASIMIPFVFGNTGGNLANGGIACEQGSTICRMDIVDGVPGLYTWDEGGEKRLLVEGMGSQLNISGGYLYYLFDINNRNRSGLLNRIPIDGSGEPQQINDEKLVFVLAVGDRIYVTLDNSGKLIAMNSDGTDVETIVEKGCYDLGGSGQLLYYTDITQRVFCMLDLVSGETATIPLTERGFAQIMGDRVYYQNESDNKRLYSCALDGSDEKILLDKKVTGVNVSENGIYCINEGDGSKPYLVSLDGSDVQKLADVKANYIGVSRKEVFIYDTKGNFYLIDETGTVEKIEY